MSPRGKQVSIRDIKGGLRTADDPRRTPARFFRELVNAEYDIRGRLVKSKGYSLSQFSPIGHVRDIKRVRDSNDLTLSYLVASDYVDKVDSISGVPGTPSQLSSCASKLYPNYSGAYYFLNNSTEKKLVKTQVSGASFITAEAGVIPPDPSTLVPEVKAAATGLWRQSGVRLWPGGSPYNYNQLPLSYGTPTSLTRKHTVGEIIGSYQVTNPDYAVDTDLTGTTYADVQMWGSAPISMFVLKPDPTPFITPTWNPNDPNYLTNPTNTYYNPADGTFRAPPGVTNYNLSIQFEGTIGIYYGYHAPQSGNPYPNDVSIIAPSISTYTPKTRFIAAPNINYWPAYIVVWGYPTGNTRLSYGAQGRVYDVFLQTTLTQTRAKATYTLKKNPLILGVEHFNRVYFPIRSNTLTTTPRAYQVVITEINETTGAVTTETRTANLNSASTYLDPGTFTNTFHNDSQGLYTTKIEVSPAVSGAGTESITLAPAYSYFNLGEGNYEYVGPSAGAGVVPAQMALRLVRTLTAGIYEYSGEVQDLQGFRSNYFTPVKRVTVVANDTIGISSQGIYNFLSSNPQIREYIIGRTLVGGGTMYQLKEITLSTLDLFQHSDASLFTIGSAPAENSVSPTTLLDMIELPSATPLDTDLTPPTDLNFVEDSLRVFRKRLWGIVRIPDSLGTIRTYIRWSEVEGFDYWNPLNEISLQDDIISLAPFRDDVLLAFSASKVYRIFPSGDQFTYEKISDTGIGGIGMSVSTHELVFWYNIHGAWVFDGAQVIKIGESENIIEQIQEMIQAGGVISKLQRENQIWFSHVIPGGFNRSIVFSTLFKNFIFRHSANEILTIIEEDDLLTSPVYFGLDGAIGIKSSAYLDNATPIISTIRTKRFCSRDVNDLRLQYMAINRRNEASGVFVVSTIFANGRTITKTRSLTGSEAFMPYLDWFEVYGTDAWFEVLLTHTSNTPFELLDYTLGAYPIDLAFDAAGSVKESDSGS